MITSGKPGDLVKVIATGKIETIENVDWEVGRGRYGLNGVQWVSYETERGVYEAKELDVPTDAEILATLPPGPKVLYQPTPMFYDPGSDTWTGVLNDGRMISVKGDFYRKAQEPYLKANDGAMQAELSDPQAWLDDEDGINVKIY